MNRFIMKFFTLCFLMIATQSVATVRIKDIADFEGVRDNMLVGYGLVVGLDGTGDMLNTSAFTKESIIAMLERLGVNARDDALRTNNVAAVMVTATLPPFARQGTRIDVTVSAIGDAESLQGGMLVVTPLMGADSEVYAVAQGSIAVGGFTAQGAGASITRGVPTNGRISNGAIVEQEIEFDIQQMKTIRVALRNPDFTTAERMAAAINKKFNSNIARVTDSGTVSLPVLPQADPIRLMTEIEQLSIKPDTMAKVVVDENSGVVVIGENVRISTVAIAQGNLTIKISEQPQVSQPNAFGEGETVVVPRTDITAEEEQNKLGIVRDGVSLQDLVSGLNALGVGPRDLIVILQSIKAAGALQADIEVL